MKKEKWIIPTLATITFLSVVLNAVAAWYIFTKNNSNISKDEAVVYCQAYDNDKKQQVFDLKNPSPSGTSHVLAISCHINDNLYDVLAKSIWKSHFIFESFAYGAQLIDIKDMNNKIYSKDNTKQYWSLFDYNNEEVCKKNPAKGMEAYSCNVGVKMVKVIEPITFVSWNLTDFSHYEN